MGARCGGSFGNTPRNASARAACAAATVSAVKVRLGVASYYFRKYHIFTPASLRDSVPLFRKRQCERILFVKAAHFDGVAFDLEDPVDADGMPRVISDCHFAVHPSNRFIPVVPSSSVVCF